MVGVGVLRQWTGMSRNEIYERIASGHLPAPVKRGKSWHWDRPVITAWVEEYRARKRQEPPAPPGTLMTLDDMRAALRGLRETLADRNALPETRERVERTIARFEEMIAAGRYSPPGN